MIARRITSALRVWFWSTLEGWALSLFHAAEQKANRAVRDNHAAGGHV